MCRARNIPGIFLAHSLGLLVAGCGAGPIPPDDPGQAAAGTGTIAYDDVLEKAYDDAYSVPAGFYVDERTDTPQSYTVHHVTDNSASFELCTDDYDQAQAWEESDNEHRAVNGFYVDSYENDLYFEIVRELSYPAGVGNVQGGTSPGYARIFKCASIDRTGVDRNLRDGFGGVLNVRPLTSSAVRELAEYLWQFAFFDTSRRKVLESFTVESAATIDHTLRLAFVHDQGPDQCDRIEVFDWTYRADRLDGDVARTFEFLFALEARVVSGSPRRCDPSS